MSCFSAIKTVQSVLHEAFFLLSQEMFFFRVSLRSHECCGKPRIFDLSMFESFRIVSLCMEFFNCLWKATRVQEKICVDYFFWQRPSESLQKAALCEKLAQRSTTRARSFFFFSQSFTSLFIFSSSKSLIHSKVHKTNSRIVKSLVGGIGVPY